MRELYSLAQTIDLLRAGRLPETADALAGRFIAVHTALTEGGWATAGSAGVVPVRAGAISVGCNHVASTQAPTTDPEKPGVDARAMDTGRARQRKRGRLDGERKERRPKRPRPGERTEPRKRRRRITEGRCASLEGVARGSTEEVRSRVEVSPASAKTDELENRLAGAGPLPLHLGKGLNLFEQLAGRRVSFDSTGRAILWTLLIFPLNGVGDGGCCGLANYGAGQGNSEYSHAPRAGPKEPCPLTAALTKDRHARRMGPSGWDRKSFVCRILRVSPWKTSGWPCPFWQSMRPLATAASVMMSGHRRLRSALRAIREGVKRVLPEDLDLPRSSADAEKELASRYLDLHR